MHEYRVNQLQWFNGSGNFFSKIPKEPENIADNIIYRLSDTAIARLQTLKS